MNAELFFRNIFGERKLSKPAQIRGSFSFKRGMRDFFDALLSALTKRRVSLNIKSRPTPGELLKWIRQGEWIVFCCGPKQTLSYFHAFQMGESTSFEEKFLIQNVLPSELVLSLLESIEMISLIKVTVLFDQKDSDSDPEDPRGFGILFPAHEEFNSLGVLMEHLIFEHRGNEVCEAWILGGSQRPEQLNWSDERILDSILKDRARVFRTQPKIKSYRITRWKDTLPQYTNSINELSKWKNTQKPPLFLHGNYLGKIGLSKIYEESSNLSERMKSFLDENLLEKINFKKTDSIKSRQPN
jgi:hypothetical protein